MSRAIDRHEDSIVDVLDMCDDGVAFDAALGWVARRDGLTAERLHQLVQVWCAIADVEVPS